MSHLNEAAILATVLERRELRKGNRYLRCQRGPCDFQARSTFGLKRMSIFNIAERAHENLVKSVPIEDRNVRFAVADHICQVLLDGLEVARAASTKIAGGEGQRRRAPHVRNFADAGKFEQEVASAKLGRLLTGSELAGLAARLVGEGVKLVNGLAVLDRKQKANLQASLADVFAAGVACWLAEYQTPSSIQEFAAALEHAGVWNKLIRPNIAKLTRLFPLAPSYVMDTDERRPRSCLASQVPGNRALIAPDLRPKCEGCQKTMAFVCQLNWADIPFGREGERRALVGPFAMLAIFDCARCKRSLARQCRRSDLLHAQGGSRSGSGFSFEAQLDYATEAWIRCGAPALLTGQQNADDPTTPYGAYCEKMEGRKGESRELDSGPVTYPKVGGYPCRFPPATRQPVCPSCSGRTFFLLQLNVFDDELFAFSCVQWCSGFGMGLVRNPGGATRSAIDD